jgi:uncharacterized surface protein with fasciclin (FAS1) repeats
MAGEPVATAASNNPLLTTLAEAVKAANLTDWAKILKYHVIGQRYDAQGLIQARTVDTMKAQRST